MHLATYMVDWKTSIVSTCIYLVLKSLLLLKSAWKSEEPIMREDHIPESIFIILR